MNLLGSYTPDDDLFLFNLGERSSTSITGSLPLLFRPFTAALLKGDIGTLHHVTQRCKKNHTRQQALLAQDGPKLENWDKALNSWELGSNHVNMCVCVSQSRHYTCRARRVTTNTPTIHTKSIRNQIPIFNYQIYNKNTQSKRHITRYVTHIEKETKPIPLLEDWWRGRENMENIRICVWTLWFREGFRQEG